MVSVTCGNITREITPEDSPNPISVTEIKVLKSAIAMGVVNELLPGTKVNASDWLKFQVDIDN
ncbi:MAG: hypothetical protein HRU18_07300 [Pseudoalteromonas sp.]|uniref:hypothetical protein n=1 Tax=Pseudoalteromonas sp. TaxID=53249 RepID=UPI001DF06DA6|nr:hypothetical protein [Pseudoalteromonas sp.]NRA77998.1 hypothetical protein [Pseudoalteromonas sp.]